jgi:hypothetical protein
MIWLLDTNMLVYARDGVRSVVSRLDEVWERGEVVTSLLVVGELIYGVEKSIRREANLAAVDCNLSCSMPSSTLVTNDGALLDGTIPGLTVENWKA